MGKHSFFGGVAKFTLAAATVAGICYMFKDEIKNSKAYQDLDMDDKILKAKTAIKDTTATIKEKAQEKAPWLANKEDEIIDDNEIILDDATPSERDYVSLDTDADSYEAATEDSAEAATEEPVEEEVAEEDPADEISFDPVTADEDLVAPDADSDNDADTIFM